MPFKRPPTRWFYLWSCITQDISSGSIKAVDLQKAIDNIVGKISIVPLTIATNTQFSATDMHLAPDNTSYYFTRLGMKNDAFFKRNASREVQFDETSFGSFLVDLAEEIRRNKDDIQTFHFAFKNKECKKRFDVAMQNLRKRISNLPENKKYDDRIASWWTALSAIDPLTFHLETLDN